MSVPLHVRRTRARVRALKRLAKRYPRDYSEFLREEKKYEGIE